MKGRDATRLTAGVRDLDSRDCAHALDESRDTRQRLNVAVVINSHIAGRDAALRRDAAGFDEHQSGSAYRAAAEMD